MRTIACLLPMLLVGACNPRAAEVVPGTAALRTGSFEYVPVSDSDIEPAPRALPNVGVTSLDLPPPLVIARSARFGARFTLATGAADETLVVSAPSPTFFATDAGAFMALHHGFGALLATGRDAVDYVHVEVHEIATLTIATDASLLAGLHPGDRPTVGVIAKDAAGATLAGSLPVRWSSTTPEIAALVSTSDVVGAKYRIEAHAAGTTTVLAQVDGVEARLDVEVLP